MVAIFSSFDVFTYSIQQLILYPKNNNTKATRYHQFMLRYLCYSYVHVRIIYCSEIITGIPIY